MIIQEHFSTLFLSSFYYSFRIDKKPQRNNQKLYFISVSFDTQHLSCNLYSLKPEYLFFEATYDHNN